MLLGKFDFCKVFICCRYDDRGSTRHFNFFSSLMLTQLLLMPIVITNNLHILLYTLRATFSSSIKHLY